MLKNNKKILSVLFDLDGTLADTSQDMCDSLNRILDLRDLKQVDCVNLRKYISRGAIGVIEYASVVNGKSIDSSLLRSEFLEDYKNIKIGNIDATPNFYGAVGADRVPPLFERYFTGLRISGPANVSIKRS